MFDRWGSAGSSSGVRRAGSVPASLAREPQRAREVMEGDHRLDALLTKLAQHVAVVTDLARVELAPRRFDSRPLDRQPVGVLVHLSEQREVLAIAVVVIAGDGGRIAVGDPSRLPLEFPPVAVLVAALNLVGGAGCAPEKSVWESRRRARHAAALAGFGPFGGGMYSHATGLPSSMSTCSAPARSIALR